MKNTNRKIKNNGGQVMLTIVAFFLVASMVIVFGIINPILKQVSISQNIRHSDESFYSAQSALEDIVYRLKNNKQVSATETLSLNGGTTVTTITDVAGGKEITSSASVNSDVRKLTALMQLGTGIDFHYGVQSGQGGFVLQNSSSITGNVFSGGTVVGAGNMIYGDVISAGAAGLVDGIHATGTVYAHSIKKTSSNSTIIDKDAYYTTKDAAAVVNGTLYPGSADQPVQDLPISDAQIAQWESDAVAGGVMASGSCDSYSAASQTCTISSSKTIGPIKVPFNLLIKSSSGVVTIAGPVWVTGNITAQTGPTIKMSASLGSQNVAIIADNPANTTGSGIINIGQSTIFQGSGTSGSFVFLISMNNSAETGGSTDALTLSQGASALVAYASHGQVTLSQSVSVKEVTAYKIILTQSANVTYDTGLPNTLFKSGPAGGYAITSWKEVQ